MQEALRLSAELLPDQERVLGRDHPNTLATRGHLAHWTGQTGDAQEALRRFVELLPDQERVLGRDHPDTLNTRNNIAHWTGQTGDAREALRRLRRTAARPGAGAGPRPPRHAHDSRLARGIDHSEWRPRGGMSTAARGIVAHRNKVRHRSSVDTANSRQDPRPRLRRSGADRSSYARASLIIRPTAIRPR